MFSVYMHINVSSFMLLYFRTIMNLLTVSKNVCDFVQKFLRKKNTEKHSKKINSENKYLLLSIFLICEHAAFSTPASVHINVTLRFQYSHINPIGGDFYVATPPPSNTIRICQLWMRSLSSSMHTYIHISALSHPPTERKRCFSDVPILHQRNEKCGPALHIKSSFEGINDDSTAAQFLHARIEQKLTF